MWFCALIATSLVGKLVGDRGTGILDYEARG
jgi:hypothetical protein